MECFCSTENELRWRGTCWHRRQRIVVEFFFIGIPRAVSFNEMFWRSLHSFVMDEKFTSYTSHLCVIVNKLRRISFYIKKFCEMKFSLSKFSVNFEKKKVHIILGVLVLFKKKGGKVPWNFHKGLQIIEKQLRNFF